MLERLVAFSVENRRRLVVLGIVLLVASPSIVRRLPIDAVPDVTNVQVVVLTEATGLSAEEMERFVTFPVEMATTGLPGLTEQRSVTRAGLSAVTLVFDDGLDIWRARQLVGERLREVAPDLPDNVTPPQLAPVSTGLGEIYQFVVRSDRHSPMDLRSALQWDIAPRLRSVSGVIEVNPMGGMARQYEIEIDPRQLSAHHISLGEVLRALETNNANVGGGWIERGPEQMVIRGEGQLRSLEDIGAVMVRTDETGTPVLIRHLGIARVGGALPYGVVTRDGEGDAVTGVVMMLIGQNSRDVVAGVHQRMREIRADLPEGMSIDVVYDRADFIERTLRTVAINLAEGALLVGLVVLLFLRSWRAALLVTLGIPFSMTIAVLGMLSLDVPGSLMSLGAIDFGLLVDGPIVMVEATIAALAAHHSAKTLPESSRVALIQGALSRVARPVVFSVLIILLVYVPLLALEGQEGKMFRPMATTMCLALAGSLIFALLVFPAGAALFLRDGHHDEAGFFSKLERAYGRAVRVCVARRTQLAVVASMAALLTIPVAMNLGADFVPRIDEGDIVVAARRIPSIGATEARRLDLATERVLKRFPEVVTVLGMTGRSEVATDPVGLDNSDYLVRLRPKAEWTTAHDLDGLGEAMKSAIESEVPSTFVSISQPIEDRTNELISGSRADVAILLFGDDLVRMTEVGRAIAAKLRNIQGTGDIRVERALGLPALLVRSDRERLSRYGLNSDDVLSAVEASRLGRRVGHVFEGQRRYELRVMLPPSEHSVEGFSRLPVGSVDGELIPIGQVANVSEEDGPAQISRQNLQRRLRIEVNLRGRDLVSYVAEAQAVVNSEIALPTGYRLEWGGQFENFQRATQRLALVVPLALAIIFAMLLGAFGDLRTATAVFASVPFALIGGILALAARAMPFSIPAAVGFIALCGIAVLNGVVMASEVRRLIGAGASMDTAVEQGSVQVLRAMLLTATVAAVGFLPMALSSSAGSEVQRPLATVVIGGMVSSTLLGLFLLPGLLRFFLRAEKAQTPTESA